MPKNPPSDDPTPLTATPKYTLASEHAVLRTLSARHVRPNLATGNWLLDHRTLTHAEFARLVWVEHPDFNPRFLQVVIEEMYERLRSAAVGKIVAPLLECSPKVKEAAAELDDFLNIILPSDCTADRRAYARACFRQIIWQVKRKLRGLQSHWDTMVILVGPQGTGKSTAIHKFARPLDLLYMSGGNFDVFTDGFRIGVLSKYYLICFDELGRARHTDIERVKNVITATTVQARGMRSESERHLPRNASFVGTSNESVVESVSDHTGMRRFAEIQGRTEKVDAEFIRRLASVNFHLVWQCETGLDDSAPLLGAADLAARYQDEIAIQHPWDYWSETNVERVDDVEITSLKTFFTHYCEEQSINGSRAMSIQKFAKRFERQFGPGIRHGNARHWRGLRLRA